MVGWQEKDCKWIGDEEWERWLEQRLEMGWGIVPMQGAFEVGRPRWVLLARGPVALD
jgi:hypothetical protein